MKISRFINKFILISLIFSATQPALAMDEPTNLSLSNRLKSFITSPKTVTFLGLLGLGGYGYKTGNWEIAASLMGTTFALYKIFDYRRNMAWRSELETLIPKKSETAFDIDKIIKAAELLHKINDKRLNIEMSYWTYPAFKLALEMVIDRKKTDIILLNKILVHLSDIINNNFSLKSRVNKIYKLINRYHSVSYDIMSAKIEINKKIEEKHAEILKMLND